jgi:hypothetical protein
MKATGEKISARVDEMDEEANASLDVVDVKVDKVSVQTRVRFEKRKTKIKANHIARKKRLQDANSVAESVTA